MAAGRAERAANEPDRAQLLGHRPPPRRRERRAGSANLSAIAQDIIRQSPEKGDYLMRDATAVPLQSSLTRRVGSTLYVLLGAVFFLLLVACANVTNLLLAQAAARQRELAIRHALGAGRGRLVRQFLAETLVLLAVSCLAGLLIATLGRARCSRSRRPTCRASTRCR